MTQGYPFIFFALVANLCAFFCLLYRCRKASLLILTLVSCACAFSFFLRYFHAFPMLPMYAGLHGTLCLMVIFQLVSSTLPSFRKLEGVLLQGVIILLNLVLFLFPKDFYLPMFRSVTSWSHMFLLTGIMARACLLMAVTKGACFLLVRPTRQQDKTGLAPATSWGMWGFAWLSLSMFSGEFWSYLGWGTPVVWHDPAITTTMAIWFYWIAFLHLHYSRNWRNRDRAIFMVAGGILLLFSFWPDMGPFRSPFQWTP